MSSIKIYKEKFLNYVGAHPRLISIMAAVGISFTFSLVGKTVIYHILEPAYAIPDLSCPACAEEFTPKEDPTIPGWDPDRAEEDAPGFEQESPGDAKDLSPGQLKKKEIIESD